MRFIKVINILLELWILQIIQCSVTNRDAHDDVYSTVIHIGGNPAIHDELQLLVKTPSRHHNISLTRVTDEVMSPDVKGFVVFEDKDGKTEIHSENLPNHMLKYNQQFFHNLDTGTIVSVIPGPGGDIHVEGFLSDDVIIAPPGSDERHRRDLHPSKHTVWTENGVDGFVDYLEVPEYFKDVQSWKAAKKQSIQKRSLSDDDDGDDDDDDEDEDDDEERSDREREEPKEVEFTDYLEVPHYFDNEQLFKQTPHHQRVKRQTNAASQYVIEVFLLVDYKVFEWFNKDIAKIGTYILHFWQAVNYKFRTMKDPNVSVKVKQYGAVQSKKFQTFIEENRIPGDTSLISLKDVLDGFRQWMIKFESNIYYAPHDVAVLMTGEDLCRMNGTSECFKLTAGIGYVKGACISSSVYSSSTYDVAVSEMGKSFKGVLVSAHEVGHLIGAYHDGEGDAKDCPKDSGYIMSYTRNNATMFTRFSECSKRSIRNFISNTWYSRCLQETSNTGYSFPDILPGQYMKISDQCFQYSHGYPCPAQLVEQRCEKLCCENQLYRVRRREPAVDGTDCGNNKICMNGACIPLPVGQ